MVVDKTGTLTEGKPKVMAVDRPGRSRDEACALPRALEGASEHPLRGASSPARREAAGAREVTDFESVTGKGVRHVEAAPLRSAIPLMPSSASTQAPSSEGGALRLEGRRRFRRRRWQVAGVVAVADPVKATTPDAIRRCTREGIRVVMLTGDNRTTAEAVARRLGIDEVRPSAARGQKSE